MNVRGMLRTECAVSDVIGFRRNTDMSLIQQSNVAIRRSRDDRTSEQLIVFDNVSKFYGEILGVNRVSLEIPAGITSLVGPNGAGKTTLMNLMCGLLRPTRGKLTVLGIPTDQPERLFRKVGYCSQFDSFPRGLTGREFISAFLMVSGFPRSEAHELTEGALSRVELLPAADRKIGAYSKGMRQRVRLAQSIAHQPSVLILDEPLNGLDPMVRAETIALFKQLAADGLHLIISSHILHEVDMMSDRVVLLNNGYVVAEGAIHGCARRNGRRASDAGADSLQSSVRRWRRRCFGKTDVVEARVHDDKQGLFVKTRNPDQFYLSLNDVVAQGEISVESITPVDDDLSAVYEYLIGAQ